MVRIARTVSYRNTIVVGQASAASTAAQRHLNRPWLEEKVGPVHVPTRASGVGCCDPEEHKSGICVVGVGRGEQRLQWPRDFWRISAPDPYCRVRLHLLRMMSSNGSIMKKLHRKAADPSTVGAPYFHPTFRQARGNKVRSCCFAKTRCRSVGESARLHRGGEFWFKKELTGGHLHIRIGTAKPYG
jgi:hypothetical protein